MGKPGTILLPSRKAVAKGWGMDWGGWEAADLSSGPFFFRPKPFGKTMGNGYLE